MVFFPILIWLIDFVENMASDWLFFLLLLKASSTDFDKWYYRLPTPTQVLQTRNCPLSVVVLC